MGEFTAVASAKRAALGDFSDGAMVDDPSEEETEEARALEVMVICFGFCWLCGMTLGNRFAEV